MNNDYLAHQDAVIATTASKVTVYAWAGSVWGVLTDSGFALAVGTVVTVAGFAVAFYFNRRKHQREKLALEADQQRNEQQQEWAMQEHMLRMEKLKLEIQGIKNEHPK